MLICRPESSPLHILHEKLTADPSRVVLRPFHLAWQSNVSEPPRAAQLAADILGLDEDQAELIWRTLISWNVNYEKGIIAARKRQG